EQVDVLFWSEPLHRYCFGFAGCMCLWMLFPQPPYCSTCPQTVEAFCSGNIGPFVECAVAAKNPSRRENRRHLLKCCQLVRNEMNCITEKGGICILHEFGKIGCFSLNEVCLHL